MRRYHLIAILVLVVAAGALAAVYFFYFREQWEQYSKDEELREKLDRRLSVLEGEFNNCQPELVVSQWAGAIQPWADAVERRSGFFSMGDVLTIDPIPEDRLPTLKFYYEEKLNGLFFALQQDAWNQGVPIPATTFGVPTMDDLQGASVSSSEVGFWLQKVKLGCAITRKILKAKPIAIEQIELWWPPVDVYGVLRLYTAGIQCTMTLENLARFMDDVSRDQTQFCAIKEFQIGNPYLRAYQDPPLQVSFLLTMASYTEPTPGAPAAPAPTAGVQQFEELRKSRESLRAGTVREKPKSFWEKIWPFSRSEPSAPVRPPGPPGAPGEPPASDRTAGTQLNPLREGGV